MTIGLLFSGQGAQHVGMSKSLYEHSAIAKALYDNREKLELINAKNEVEVEKLTIDLNKNQKILTDYYKNLIKIEENKKLESLILGYKSKIENINIEREKLIRDVEGKRNDVDNGKNLIIESNNIIKTIETEQKIMLSYLSYHLIFSLIPHQRQ